MRLYHIFKDPMTNPELRVDQLTKKKEIFAESD